MGRAHVRGGRLRQLEVRADYRGPPIDTPGGLPRSHRAANAASFADLEWWEVGVWRPGPQWLLHRLLKGNYDLQTAVASVGQARAQVGVAASQLC
jgi:hypothetical protein